MVGGGWGRGQMRVGCGMPLIVVSNPTSGEGACYMAFKASNNFPSPGLLNPNPPPTRVSLDVPPSPAPTRVSSNGSSTINAPLAHPFKQVLCALYRFLKPSGQ
jgi:hypothetical protein